MINLLDQVRSRFKNVYVQGFCTDVLFGLKHLVGCLKITLEAVKRGVTAADRPEVDLMLRISCTNQISKAIPYAGMKPGKDSCIVMFSKRRNELCEVRGYLLTILPKANSIELIANTYKRNSISASLNFETGSYYARDNDEFLNYLIERAALIRK